MTNGELIQRVESLYNKGVETDETRLTPVHIFNKLSALRSTLLIQKANKKQKLSEWTYQVISCIPMVKAKAVECPCVPPKGCQILKSENPIPRILRNIDGYMIKSVTSIDGEVRYSKTSWERKKYKSGERYTKAAPDFFIFNDFLFITQTKTSKLVTLRAVFDQPSEVYNFPTKCDEDCTGPDCPDCISYFDREFPIDPDLTERLVNLAQQELVMSFSQMQEDTTNNSTETNTPTAK